MKEEFNKDRNISIGSSFIYTERSDLNVSKKK